MLLSVDISITVCTYNRRTMLEKALKSLIAQEHKNCFTYEILVIDDGSNDGTKELVESMISKSQVPIRYIQGGGIGVPNARNNGLQAARGEWIAFFDDDQLAADDWLINLWLTAKKNNTECVGGMRLLHLSSLDLSKIDSVTRAFLGEIKVLNEGMKTNRKWFPNTGNSLVKKEIFNIVGYFDETCLSGGEDLDFFRRVRMAGFRVWETPAAIVYHIIPKYRFNYSYLKWTALRSGVSYAKIDLLEFGRLRLFTTALARLGQAIIFCIPGFVLATLRQDKPKITGRKCQIMKTVGYVRKTIVILCPGISQKAFFEKLEFRREIKNYRNNKDID